MTKHARKGIKRKKKNKKRNEEKRRQFTFDPKVFQRSARRWPLPWITYLFHFTSTTSSSSKPQRILECPPGETFGLRTSRVKNLSALKLIRQRAHSQVRFECLLLKGRSEIAIPRWYRPRLFHFPRGRCALRENLSRRKFDANTRFSWVHLGGVVLMHLMDSMGPV